MSDPYHLNFAKSSDGMSLKQFKKNLISLDV